MLELIAYVSLGTALAIAAVWFAVWQHERSSPQARLHARSWREYQEKLQKAQRGRR